MQQNMISIANAPRDLAALTQLKRRQLYLLATNLKLLNDEQRESAFLAMSPEQQAGTVLQGLQAMDAAGGAPMEVAPAAQPQVAPAAVPVAAAPPQAPAPVAPAPAAPAIPPAGYAPAPMAPPPAQPVAAPPPPQMPAPMAPQPPQAPAAPPMPMAPQAPPPAPAAPVAAPPMPPQPVAPPPPQAPPPMAPQPVAAPPAPAPVPMAPQAAPPAAMPPRTPQTATDPGASAGGPAPQLQQLVGILTKMNAGQEAMAKGLDGLSKNVNGSVLLQRVILQILLTLAELQGMDQDALIKQVKLGDADAVEKFIAALGTSQGKS